MDLRKQRIFRAYKLSHLSRSAPSSPPSFSSLCYFLPYFVLFAIVCTSLKFLSNLYKENTSNQITFNISQWHWIVNLTDIDIQPLSAMSLELPGLSEKLLEMENGLIVNPHNFNYKLNPGHMICSPDGLSSRNAPLILIYIHTDPSHDKRRLLIRETFGSPYNFDDIEVRTIFMCGATNSTIIQEALELEFDRYKDIVQEDFIDTYRNLTYKGIMALKWISTYCMNAQLIIKVDDDIFINIFKMMNKIKNIMWGKERRLNQDMFICNVWDKMQVLRDPKSKWYISKKEFPDEYFGRYCSGSVYAYTTHMAPLLFQASKYVPFFWVDDYYITGMLPRKLKQPIRYEEINNFYFLSPTLFLDKFKKNDGDGEDGRLAVGHTHDLNHFKYIWRKVVKKYRNSSTASNFNLTRLLI